MVCLAIEHHGGTSTGHMMMTQDRLGSSLVLRLELTLKCFINDQNEIFVCPGAKESHRVVISHHDASKPRKHYNTVFAKKKFYLDLKPKNLSCSSVKQVVSDLKALGGVSVLMSQILLIYLLPIVNL
jgi:hypothetical protein